MEKRKRGLGRPIKPRIRDALVPLFVDCTMVFIPKAPNGCAESQRKAGAHRSGTGFFVSLSHIKRRLEHGFIDF